MNDTKNKMLMKLASQDRAPGLIANVYMAEKLTKIARQQAVREFTINCALKKKADFDFSKALNGAWDGIKNWWSDDANKAGLATGALGALGTYGLTGLVPGLRRNQALRLALSAAGGFGGYKGGQWGANKLMSDANAKGQATQAAIDAEAAKQQAEEFGNERNHMQSIIDAAKAQAEKDQATIGGLKGDLAGVNKNLEAAKAREEAGKANLAAATAERDALKATTDPKNVNYLNAGKQYYERRDRETRDVYANAAQFKVDTFMKNLKAMGELSQEEGAAAIEKLMQKMQAVADPDAKAVYQKAIQDVRGMMKTTRELPEI